MTISQKINATTTIKIVPLAKAESITGPYYAINFFNTKLAWLYGFYNLVAAHPARKAGGKAFIKIRHQKTLSGKPENGRQFLLLVHYAEAESFLNLMADKFFQLVSIFRILSVRDFSFVLSQRVDVPDIKKLTPLNVGKEKTYGLHHFGSKISLEDNMKQIKHLTKNSKVTFYFASVSAAKIVVEENGKEPIEMPFITDNLVLFEADGAEEMEAFILARDYQEFSKTLDHSFIGLYSRVL